MAYLEEKTIQGKKYYFLAENMRIGAEKWKKVRIYLGAENINAIELELKKIAALPKLKEKAKYFLRHAPASQAATLTSEQIKALKKIRQNYKRHIGNLTPADIEKLEENILENFTYNTNAIEGGHLTLADVRSVFEGATPAGKPLRDIYGAKNMREAYNYVKQMRRLSQKELLELHKISMRDILSVDLGKYRAVQVYVGKHVPPRPEKVRAMVCNLFAWYRTAGKKLHPFELACKLHIKFENIHPFRDGNGRVGRLIMNYVLLRAGYPLLDIKFENRPEYYNALEKFELEKADFKPFIAYAFRIYLTDAKRRGWL